jgi:murein DD-endopeptidase MepM/ murein hydrolase activator NlpD
MRRNPRLVVASLAAMMALAVGLLDPGAAQAEDVGGPNGVDQADFQMPFPCGEVWGASTHADHPAVDWNGVGPAAGSADFGLPVQASLGGTVLVTGEYRGYGQRVVIDHGDGWSTLYGHLSAITVVPGQVVVMGTPVGNVGNTGTSGGPHLHWEQRYLGQAVPELWAGGAPVSTTYGSPGPTYTSGICPTCSFGVSLVPTSTTAAPPATAATPDPSLPAKGILACTSGGCGPN